MDSRIARPSRGMVPGVVLFTTFIVGSTVGSFYALAEVSRNPGDPTDEARIADRAAAATAATLQQVPAGPSTLVREDDQEAYCNVTESRWLVPKIDELLSIEHANPTPVCAPDSAGRSVYLFSGEFYDSAVDLLNCRARGGLRLGKEIPLADRSQHGHGRGVGLLVQHQDLVRMGVGAAR